MATELFELGSVSSRGQIAIPAEMRKELGLEEGTRVLFVVENDTILMKKVTTKTFAELVKPLHEAVKKSGLREADVPDIIHRFRKSKNESHS